MSLLGTNCTNCRNNDCCSLILGFRTAWCKIESLYENLTKDFYCGTITMKCDSYSQKEENDNEHGYGL